MGCGAMGDEVNMVPEASCCDSCCAAIATGCLLLRSLAMRAPPPICFAAENDGVPKAVRGSKAAVMSKAIVTVLYYSFLLKKPCSFET